MADLAARARSRDKAQPVATRLVARLRNDFDDVAVLEARAQRYHPPVYSCADALVPNVGMNGVRKVNRSRAPRQGLHFSLGREDVDLFGIQIDLEVLQELLRIAYLLLDLEQLAHPVKIALVAVVTDPPFLVLPVGGNPFFSMPVHLLRSDLHLEGDTVFADDGGVERLIAVRPRHGNEVFDSAGHRRPRLMDDAERRIAVLD